jgi:hypothetical protein
MLVQGTCKNGHDLVCSVREGKLRGAVVRGALRCTCPNCGTDVFVPTDQGVIVMEPLSSRRIAG